MDNLKYRPHFTVTKRVNRISNRDMIMTTTLADNQNWLLDTIFDSYIYETQEISLRLPNKGSNGEELAIRNKVLVVMDGKNRNFFNFVIQVFKQILNLNSTDNITIGIGAKGNRQVAITVNNKLLIRNLFQLSTGETQVLNIALSILRDYDMTGSEIKQISDITGIVIIDEIDVHAHIIQQVEIIPKLIQIFPKIQFIISTHSPFFTIGLEKELGRENFKLIEMPTGTEIAPSDFAEIYDAYNAFKNTTTLRAVLEEEIINTQKPIVFVEGDYDIKYIRKAAMLHSKQNLLEKIKLKDGDGYGNLNNIWKILNKPLAANFPMKVLLLYDCDIQKPDTTIGYWSRKTIPTQSYNPIEKGIENLFSEKTIQKLEKTNQKYIDITPSSTKRVRGETVQVPEKKSVNPDEKRNICDWLCEHGDLDDFVNFNVVLDLLEEL